MKNIQELTAKIAAAVSLAGFLTFANRDASVKALIAKIDAVKAKVEKKARLKKSYRRCVDARNILAIIHKIA